MEYEVVYRVDIEADSPEEAAEHLAEWLPLWAPRAVYEVRPREGGAGVQIDLSGELEPCVLAPREEEK